MMNLKKITKATLVGAMLCLTLTSCVKPYDTPEFITIEASQTAFLIPLTGDTENQASFESAELLAQAKVATKEIQIPHRWVQTGRMDWEGEWVASAKLITVERTPETREWNASKDGGTSAINQAIYAESKESISFSVGMNCSAQIDSEQDAVTFLYSYNNKTLSQIMDTEIRAMVEAKFVETCATFTLNEILEQKALIMETVRSEVVAYFKDRGITITVLGMKDGITYSDTAIQASINEKFSSEQKLVTQQNENEVILAKATAEAEAMILLAEAQSKANKLQSEGLSQLLINDRMVDKWNGQLPQVSGSDSIISFGS